MSHRIVHREVEYCRHLVNNTEQYSISLGRPNGTAHEETPRGFVLLVEVPPPPLPPPSPGRCVRSLCLEQGTKRRKPHS